ncbi:hypothetical protein [Sphingomonas sp.]|uniref:hypothetical protein n=1 Tax=Sphingomonas sp. TaxID=28214 RepID=UPI0025DB3009|nr:hypothetical protein [Sphingomonas sp.]
MNAALAIIHGNGHDASAVSRQAKASALNGMSLQQGYEAALNSFLQSNPTLANEIARTIAVIGASDDATVNSYDQAISEFNATGSTLAMQAMMPTMAKDSVALAIRNGEITAEDVGNGGLETALGFAPSEAMMAAAMTPEAAPASAPVTAPVAPVAHTPQSVGQASPANNYNKTGEALKSWIGLPMAYVAAQEVSAPS